MKLYVVCSTFKECTLRNQKGSASVIKSLITGGQPGIKSLITGRQPGIKNLNGD